MTLSNPKITHIITTQIDQKPILPCSSSPVFQHNKNMLSTTTTVCQGFKSCLDPLLFEPGELMHQLAPPKQGLSIPWPQKKTENENSKNSPICEKSASNWNFIQSLTNNSHNHRQSNDDVTEQVYVHPLVKRSSSSLSTKSLEMCTESLGSETGNGIDSIFDEFSSGKQSSTRIKPAKNLDSSKKIKKSSNFPPPLTSISGNEGVQVKTHREGGRLVIKAFSFSSCTTYFQAERENGRLKLSLLRDGYRDDLAENEEEEEDEVEEENERDCDESDDDEDDFGGRFWGENQNLRDDGGKIGCKINGGDWSAVSRCNGDRSSRKRLPSLPFCVAIS